jgi:hypothetical protein
VSLAGSMTVCATSIDGCATGTPSPQEAKLEAEVRRLETLRVQMMDTVVPTKCCELARLQEAEITEVRRGQQRRLCNYMGGTHIRNARN